MFKDVKIRIDWLWAEKKGRELQRPHKASTATTLHTLLMGLDFLECQRYEFLNRRLCQFYGNLNGLVECFDEDEFFFRSLRCFLNVV